MDEWSRSRAALGASRRRPDRRSLVLLALVVLGVVCGLLGMHTFAVDDPGPGVRAAAVASAAAVPGEAPPVHEISPSTCAERCAAAVPHPDSHRHEMAACVLALLAGLLLFLAPRPLRLLPPGLLRFALPSIPVRHERRPHALSLLLLSISRT